LGNVVTAAGHAAAALAGLAKGGHLGLGGTPQQAQDWANAHKGGQVGDKPGIFPNTAPPGHAMGGIFNRAHLAKISEGNKPEAIIPLNLSSRSLGLLSKCGFRCWEGRASRALMNWTH